MSRIFISYRRADSDDAAGRIFDALVGPFGASNIFKDVYSIPLGVDFRHFIRKEVSECRLMLVVIGRQWLKIADEHGRRRLDDPSDLLRFEVEEALKSGIPVIPVLVQGVDMPRASDLPKSLRALVHRNGFTLRGDPYFRSDMAELISRMRDVLQSSYSLFAIPSEWANDLGHLLQQSEALAMEERFEEALVLLECAVQLAPSNEEALFWKALVLHQLDRSQDALTVINQVEEADSESNILKGDILNALQRYDEALRVAEFEIARSSTKGQAWEVKGEALEGLGRDSEAELARHQAQELKKHAKRQQ